MCHAELTVTLVIDVRAGMHTHASRQPAVAHTYPGYLRELAERCDERHSVDVPDASCSELSDECSTYRSNTVSAFEGVDVL